MSIALRFKPFDAIVTSVVGFAAGHQKLYVGELRKLDVHHQKLLWRTCWLGRSTRNQGDLDEHLNIYDFGFALPLPEN